MYCTTEDIAGIYVNKIWSFRILYVYHFYHKHQKTPKQNKTKMIPLQISNFSCSYSGFTLVCPIHFYPWPVSSPPTLQDRDGCNGCDINRKWSQGDATPQSNSGICHCRGHADAASLAHWLRLMMTVALSLSRCVVSLCTAQSPIMTQTHTDQRHNMHSDM